MKNICFIANYFKTDVFVEISKVLEKNQISTYWIVPNRKQFKALCLMFPEEKVLYIGKKDILRSGNKAIPYDLKINELIYGDRVLRHESAEWTFDYLYKLGNVVHDFIGKNKITNIFGETTWAHELVIHRLVTISEELKCKFLNPHTIRIPNGRFAFFKDEFQSIIADFDENQDTGTKNIKVEKPDYLTLNNKLLAKKGTFQYNIIKLKNFILRTNQDRNDPTLYSNPFTLFKIRVGEKINSVSFKLFVSETKLKDIPPNHKVVLFTLHKQPEASIDVIGRYYEDQLQLIKNIWRNMPKDYVFLVKEHSNAIGDRKISFYKNIKRLRNLYLIDHKEDSHKILKLSNFVFTVSGTIAYEAGLKGIPSYTFAPVFFNKINSCKQVDWKEFRNSDLFIKTETNNNIDKFSNWLISNSFEGIMSDSHGDPRCMENSNISKLAKAFMRII